MGRIVTGVGVALAVSYPAVALGAILLALDDRDIGLQPIPRTVLTLVVLAGAAVGGAFDARRHRSVPPRLVIGAAALFLVACFGVLRQAIGDDEPNLAFLLVFPAVGALLALGGGALQSALTGKGGA